MPYKTRRDGSGRLRRRLSKVRGRVEAPPNGPRKLSRLQPNPKVPTSDFRSVGRQAGSRSTRSLADRPNGGPNKPSAERKMGDPSEINSQCHGRAGLRAGRGEVVGEVANCETGENYVLLVHALQPAVSVSGKAADFR